MFDSKKKKGKTGWIIAVVLVWFVMNIRVAAGIGSTFERAIDGLVGIALLLAVVFVVMDFVQQSGNDQP